LYSTRKKDASFLVVLLLYPIPLTVETKEYEVFVCVNGNHGWLKGFHSRHTKAASLSA
jgi:hypothetical protein